MRLEIKKETGLQTFCIFTIIMLFISSLLLGSVSDIIEGMKIIILSRSALTTDYFALANYSAALFNAGLMMLFWFIIIYKQHKTFTGMTMATIFINVGFALFGKNPINILPILIGTMIYAKLQKVNIGRYIYVAAFGTCLAPIVSDLAYILPFNMDISTIISVLIGVLIGIILPPISAHTASMHMGYNLFNVGFSAGLVSMLLVYILSAFGVSSTGMNIWQYGRPLFLIIGLNAYFLIAVIWGYWMNNNSFKGLKSIFSHSGRAIADFILMDGAGVALINMGLIGLICTNYIIIIQGDLSGPVIGAILTAFGFGAFGAHPKNYLPTLLGVYLAGVITSLTAQTPSIQLAAVFAVGIAPVCGQFGKIAGITAGFLHATIVICTSGIYYGLNLYNNGFSCGLVAIFLVPIIESIKNIIKIHTKNNRRT